MIVFEEANLGRKIEMHEINQIVFCDVLYFEEVMR